MYHLIWFICLGKWWNDEDEAWNLLDSFRWDWDFVEPLQDLVVVSTVCKFIFIGCDHHAERISCCNLIFYFKILIPYHQPINEVIYSVVISYKIHSFITIITLTQCMLKEFKDQHKLFPVDSPSAINLTSNISIKDMHHIFWRFSI